MPTPQPWYREAEKVLTREHARPAREGKSELDLTCEGEEADGKAARHGVAPPLPGIEGGTDADNGE